MMRLFPLTVSALTFALVLVAVGCVMPPATNPTNTNALVNTSSPSSPTPSQTAGTTKNENLLPLTMPVLDAFFAEESFAPELKQKLHLTDSQVSKLRTLAREETAQLREANTDEYGGRSVAARARAAEQIRSVIGPDKVQRLAELVSERWSGRSDESNEGAIEPGNERPTFNAAPKDSRVVVNIPAYRMDVFNDGKLIQSYRISIGYPEFPLPTGLRSARLIIFNPTWTPPDEPWVESAKKVKVGEKIAAGSKLNPLGLIKIPIGLPSLIHGGKAPAKLGGFASHGCVGLTNAQAQDFAKTLAQLGGVQLPEADLHAYMKDRTKTKTVSLNHSVIVELRYETIVVEDGKLHIYRDVYDQGTNSEENLRAVLETQGVSLEELSQQERAQVMDALREMARGASGKPVEPANAAGLKSSPRQPGSANRKSAEQQSSAAEGNKLTRAVKGKKEIVVEIAALRGKGYPAPVNLDTGGRVKG
jgi:L,D-transpeptidase ErfK/SrfK